MVKLEEVPDEALHGEQKGDSGAPGVAGANPLFGENDEWDTDSESDISSVSGDEDILDDDSYDESLFDRVIALKDIIPPSTRRTISSTVSTTSSYGIWGVRKAASAGWIVGVSVLLLVAPFAIATIEEQGYALEEREREMRERGVNDMMTASPTAAAVAGAVPGQGQGVQQSL